MLGQPVGAVHSIMSRCPSTTPKSTSWSYMAAVGIESGRDSSVGQDVVSCSCGYLCCCVLWSCKWRPRCYCVAVLVSFWSCRPEPL